MLVGLVMDCAAKTFERFTLLTNSGLTLAECGATWDNGMFPCFFSGN